MTFITVNGKPYNTADFEEFGHSETVTAGTGEQLPRLLAMIADVMADASRARQATSAESKNGGLSGSQSWVLASDISFAVGSRVIIARTSDPTGVWYVGQVTGYVSGTRTLTVQVEESNGAGGPYTDWTVSLTGQTGPSSNSGHGQCRLAKSGANLVLSPFNGNYLDINGTYEIVPDAGVSLAATSLAADTTYYIYAYMNTGNMTLEASTTAPVRSATTGVQIKTGDAARTLVGMARTVTGPAWEDSAAKRLVLSHFNRRQVVANAAFTADRSRSVGTYDELNSEIRNEFLCWADEPVRFMASGRVTVATSGQGFRTSIGIDGTTAEDVNSGASATGSSHILPFGFSHEKLLSVGYHYATLLGLAGAGGADWEGSGTAGERCTLRAVTMG